jgi:penicillin-binding protein 1A
VGMGVKLPAPAASPSVAANGATKPAEVRPGPPPILTKRGADILVQVEKMLEEAAKTAEPVKPVKPVSSNPVPFPDSFAAATPGNAVTSPPRKN